MKRTMNKRFVTKKMKLAASFGDYLDKKVSEPKLPEQPRGQIKAAPMKKYQKPSPYKTLPNWMKEKMRKSDPRFYA